MKTIFIYQDYVHNNAGLYKTLRLKCPGFRVSFCDAGDLLHGDVLGAGAACFIMPGGASRYVSHKLNGAGNALIKSYVAAGGVYVGLCAGAYYGCAKTVWQEKTEHEIKVTNELAFCSATAHGPLPDFVNSDGQAARKVTLLLASGRSMPAFYRGGPGFSFAEHAGDEDIAVLARYADLPGQPPAMIAGTHGQGRFILSSPHVEIDSALLDLMHFDVVANRHADISAMSDRTGLSNDYFINLLHDAIGSAA